jgi:integrase/recombinase XerC
MSALAKIDSQVLPTNGMGALIDSFLSGRKITTIQAYKRDLEQFAEFLGLDTLNMAAKHLLTLPHGQANALVLAYKAYLVDQFKLQSSTVNRRLAAIRSLVKLARMMGLVAWDVEVENRKHTPYRDVQGIGLDGVKTILNFLAQKSDKKSVRDYAIFRLLFDLGLRREEVCLIELVDLAPNLKSVSILGKGKTQKQKITLPESTANSLRAWLSLRGKSDGPLFFRLDKARSPMPKRLTGTGLYSIIQSLGREAGVQGITVHKIRHDSITEALKVAAANNIGLDDVRLFSRHSDIKTLLIYKDHIDDAQGKLAELVSKKAG